ncbi:MAG: hypothetical protein ACKPEY_16965 [Planctomycetota bacterium]
MSGSKNTSELRFRPSIRPPRQVSLGGMLTSNLLLGSLGFLLSAGMFSLLPISTAVITLPINFLLFAGWSDRISNPQYALCCFILYLALLTLLVALVTLLGRRPFDLLLG